MPREPKISRTTAVAQAKRESLMWKDGMQWFYKVQVNGEWQTFGPMKHAQASAKISAWRFARAFALMELTPSVACSRFKGPIGERVWQAMLGRPSRKRRVP